LSDDGIDRALHGAVAAPHEEQVDTLFDQLIDAVRHVLALRHLVPGRVVDAVLGQDLAELGEPAAQLLLGVCHHPDGGHGDTSMSAGRFGKAGVAAVAGGCPSRAGGRESSIAARSLASATATPVLVARKANARQPSAPITLPITSVGWCIPRYRRESATKIGRAMAAIHANVRTNLDRTSEVMMSARPTYRTIDAATCPEGKLEVGGPGSRCGTVGRSRSMTNEVVTKVVTSITNAPTRNAMCAQWRPIARTTTATAATPTTAMVSPSMEPHSVIASNVAWRWRKNQRSSA